MRDTDEEWAQLEEIEAALQEALREEHPPDVLIRLRNLLREVQERINEIPL